MWEAVAEYKDGSSVRRFFNYSEWKNEEDQQFEIECWLIGYRDGCTYYSVSYIDE